jgi:hypothetical protein
MIYDVEGFFTRSISVLRIASHIISHDNTISHVKHANIKTLKRVNLYPGMLKTHLRSVFLDDNLMTIVNDYSKNLPSAILQSEKLSLHSKELIAENKETKPRFRQRRRNFGSSLTQIHRGIDEIVKD